MPAAYQIVIGLEVHVQLLTQSKLFCGCPTTFGLPPNSATCPVCLGLPGALPVLNRRAFELALKAALALQAEIAPITKWDRKNYFYPDLPKNYQISQYDLPFSRGGGLEIATPQGRKRIGLLRIHLEEDAGKLLHEDGGQSRVDLNRAGVPLLEIVTRPELNSPEEARLFLEDLRLLLRDLEVSDCEMQEGSLRCDANINLHIPQPDGSVAATPIVEVKNLNSFRAVERALRYEAQRQYEEFQRSGRRLGDAGVSKATAGWDEERGVTLLQRRKEEAADYRYFPDPDLVPVVVDADWLAALRRQVGEVPVQTRERLQQQYGLSAYDAGVLTAQGRDLVHYFEEVARLSGQAKEACNWVTNEVLQTLHERQLAIRDFSLSAAALAELLREVQRTGLNHQRAREVYARMLQTGQPAAHVIQELGFQVVADEAQLRALIRQAIAAHPKAVADYKKGKRKAADAIKGAVMRQTRGLAKAELLQRLLLEELEHADHAGPETS